MIPGDILCAITGVGVTSSQEGTGHDARGSLLSLAAGLGHVHLVPVLLTPACSGRRRRVRLQGPSRWRFIKSDSVVDVLMKAQPDVNAKDANGTGRAGLRQTERIPWDSPREEVADTWGSHGTAGLLRKMPKRAGTPHYCHSLIVSHHVGNPRQRRSWMNTMFEGQKTFTWVKDGLTYLLKANSPVNRDPTTRPRRLDTMHGQPTRSHRNRRALIKRLLFYSRGLSYADDTPAHWPKGRDTNVGPGTVGNDGDDVGTPANGRLAGLTPDVTIRVRVLITRIFPELVQVEQNHVRGGEDSELRSGMGPPFELSARQTPLADTWPSESKRFSDFDKPLGWPPPATTARLLPPSSSCVD
ncbi:hypothetical protein GWK47_007102 [Chionoecetes opilio]|uniref:Uncharacterized protein n=1 Tax=Chionoecetes opilio TaxID=41210 RepID=A0A8J4Y9Q5_CHIOP|nr:hypothetical protein GWK47_007102 [Chionoecetes opilio]